MNEYDMYAACQKKKGRFSDACRYQGISNKKKSGVLASCSKKLSGKKPECKKLPWTRWVSYFPIPCLIPYSALF